MIINKLYSKAGLLILIVGMVLIIQSCLDNYDFDKRSEKMEFSPSLAIPIGSVNFDINKLLAKLDSSNYIRTDEKGLLYVIYEKDIQAIKGEDKVSIPAQANINIPFANFTGLKFDSNGEASTTSSIDMPVTFRDDNKIDSMVIKSLTLNLSNITSTFPHNGQLVITFPNMTKNGIAFSETFDVPANTSNLNIKTINKADGYTLKFATSAFGASNMPLQVKFILKGTAGSNVSNGLLSGLLQLGQDGEMRFRKMYGYFGQNDVVSSTDSINIDFFNNPIIKNIEWGEPKLSIFTDNGYGMPAQINFVKMDVYSQEMNTTTNITLDNTVNPKDLEYNKNSYPSVIDTVEYNRHNSTLFEALRTSPKTIKFDVKILTNAKGYDAAIYNTIVDTSAIKSKMQLHLPLWFQSKGFGRTDTLPFDLESMLSGNGTKLNSMLLRIISDNGMPIDFDLQIYFTDSTYTVLDSLFKVPDHSIVKAGKIGSDAKVSEPTHSYRDIPLNENQLRKVEHTRNLFSKVTMKTPDYDAVNGNYVKFFNTYKLKLGFACQFKITKQL